MLRRVIGATCVAASLYLTLPYVPTRWNPAGDPTRDAVLRPVYGSLDLSVWRERGGSVSPFPELPKTRRFASLWVRMVLRLLGPTCLHLPDRSMFRQSSLMKSESRSHKAHQKDFNETMGYPGEGPLFLQFLFGFCAQICHPLSSMLSLSLFGFLPWIAWGALPAFPASAVDFRRGVGFCSGRASHAVVSTDCRGEDQGCDSYEQASSSFWPSSAASHDAAQDAASE